MSTAPERTRKSDKDFLKSALQKTTDADRPYLGDPEVIEGLLRSAIADVVDQKSQDYLETALRRECKNLAKIFIGGEKSYAPVDNWNQPGGIDEQAAIWAGSSETTPAMRLEHLFVNMFNEVFQVAGLASEDAILREQYEFQLDDILKRHIWMLLGVGPAEQLNLYQQQTAEGPAQDE